MHAQQVYNYEQAKYSPYMASLQAVGVYEQLCYYHVIRGSLFVMPSLIMSQITLVLLIASYGLQ